MSLKTDKKFCESCTTNSAGNILTPNKNRLASAVNQAFCFLLLLHAQLRISCRAELRKSIAVITFDNTKSRATNTVGFDNNLFVVERIDRSAKNY